MNEYVVVVFGKGYNYTFKYFVRMETNSHNPSEMDQKQNEKEWFYYLAFTHDEMIVFLVPRF